MPKRGRQLKIVDYSHWWAGDHSSLWNYSCGYCMTAFKGIAKTKEDADKYLERHESSCCPDFYARKITGYKRS